MEFANKVVLITGASSGIGAVTAHKFAELSANLVLVGRNVENLEAVTQECEKRGSIVLTVVADMQNDRDVEGIVAKTIEKFGKIDILVNNAGIVKRAGILDGISSYDSVMATNIRSAYLLTSLSAPHIIKTKGNIINISSISAVRCFRETLSYNMSKAAMDCFTKSIAMELAPHGVRVNAIRPGLTITPMVTASGIINDNVDEALEMMKQMAPLKRASDSDEIADMIAYVAGNKSRGMTGSIINIDNGQLLM